MELTCKLCKKIFTGHHKKVSCSKECSDQIKKYNKRRYYEKNRQKVIDRSKLCREGNPLYKDYQKSYREKNRASIKSNLKEWKANNKVKVDAYEAKYRKKNKDAIYIRRKKFALDNKERELSYSKKYRETANGKAIRRTITARRRAAKLNATPKWVCKDKIKAIYLEAVRLQNETGTLMEVDHIIPLQGANVCGLHVHWNLQIISRESNRKKGSKLTDEFNSVTIKIN